MGAVAFDTLKLARKLRDSAEMTQSQAEGVADALAEAMSGAELATKGDITEAKTELKRDIGDVRVELKQDIRELELKMDGQFKEMDTRIGALADRTDAKFEMVLERIDRRAAESDGKAEAYKYALLRWVLGAVSAAIVTFVGSAWAIIHYLSELLRH